MSTTRSTRHYNGKKEGCTAPYSLKTFKEVRQSIVALYRQKKSLRKIAHEDYKDKINHAAIQRILDGHEPAKPQIRLALNMTALVPTPACPSCGEVHVKKKCPIKKPLPAWVMQAADHLATFEQANKKPLPKVWGRGGMKLTAGEVNAGCYDIFG